jgi:hypothetical protein
VAFAEIQVDHYLHDVVPPQRNDHRRRARPQSNADGPGLKGTMRAYSPSLPE